MRNRELSTINTLNNVLSLSLLGRLSRRLNLIQQLIQPIKLSKLQILYTFALINSEKKIMNKIFCRKKCVLLNHKKKEQKKKKETHAQRKY